jgi:hypothetical protein
MSIDIAAEIIGLSALVAHVPGCSHGQINPGGGWPIRGECASLTTVVVKQKPGEWRAPIVPQPRCDAHTIVDPDRTEQFDVIELATARHVRRLEKLMRGE